MTDIYEASGVCRRNDWEMCVEYSSVDNNWYVTITGVGLGEYWEVKKYRDLSTALQVVIERAKEGPNEELAERRRMNFKCIQCDNGTLVCRCGLITQQEGDKLLFCHQWIAEQARNIERLQQIIAEKDAQLDAFGIKYPQMLDNVYNDALEKAATIVESRGVDGTRYTIAGIIRDNKRKYRG